MIDKNNQKNPTKFNKKQKPSDLLELDVKKQEEELNLIKALLNNKELRENEIKKLNTKNQKNNPNKLNPISKEDLMKKPRQNSLNPSKLQKANEKTNPKALKEKQIKPKNDSLTVLETTKDETPKIPNTNKQSSIIKENTVLSERKEICQENSISKNEWLNNNNNLDNYKFRKSLTKKNEKVHINCNEIEKKMEKNDTTKETYTNQEFPNAIINEYSTKNEIENSVDQIEENTYLFIKEIFDEIKLPQYYKQFINREITNLEKLFLLEDKDLETFIPIGHRIKIFKKIKEIKRLYELFVDKTDNPPIIQENKISEDSCSVEENENIIRNNNSKTEGRLGHISCNEEAIQVVNGLLPLNIEKACCWNCLTVIDKNKAVIKETVYCKSFCSSICFENYLEKHYGKCSFEECTNLIEKENGNYMNNKIYCSYHYNPQEEHYQLQIETQKYSKEAEKESLKSSEESDSYDPMLDF